MIFCRHFPGVLAGFILSLIIIAPATSAPLPVTEVAAGVYVHQGAHEDFDEYYHGDIANIGFIVGEEAVAVIDTGGVRKVGEALREAVRRVTNLPIRYVINTHVHPDHIFGNAAFVQDNPVFVGHKKLVGAMQSRGESYLRGLRAQFGQAAEGSAIIPPTLTVESTLMLDIGRRPLELKAWPGAHTNNDLTIYDRTTETLWLSDLLFVERTPSIDGDIRGWIGVIDELSQVTARITVPGHGKVTDDKQQALNNQKRYLTILLGDVRKAIQSGTPMEVAMQQAAGTERNGWVLFDAVNRRNVNLIYPQLEWE